MPLRKTLAALKHLQVQYSFCEPRNRYTADSCDWHILDWTIKYLYRQHSKELQRTQACLSVSTQHCSPHHPHRPPVAILCSKPCIWISILLRCQD